MTTEERLEKLERELRRTKRHNRWLMGVVVLAVAGFGLAWTWGNTAVIAMAKEGNSVLWGGSSTGVRPGDKAVPEEIRARRFVLEGADGKDRAWLCVGEDGTALRLFDGNGATRVAVSVENDKPMLKLYGPKGQSRVWLYATNSSLGGVNLSDENGKTRVILAVEDGPVLGLCDKKGKALVKLGMDKEGQGLALLDENGKARGGLSVVKDRAMLSLWDENEKVRAELRVSKDGPRLSLSDENGKVVWKAPQ